MTYADFIAFFPEFNNTTRYPQPVVEEWIPVAYDNLNVARFKRQIRLAVMLFVAHNIVLQARDAQTNANGGIVGQASGPINSKSVDKVSAAYSADLTAIEGAGPWNYTTYGQRLYKMMQSFNSGPIYVPGNCSFGGYPPAFIRRNQ